MLREQKKGIINIIHSFKNVFKIIPKNGQASKDKNRMVRILVLKGCGASGFPSNRSNKNSTIPDVKYCDPKPTVTSNVMPTPTKKSISLLMSFLTRCGVRTKNCDDIAYCIHAAKTDTQKTKQKDAKEFEKQYRNYLRQKIKTNNIKYLNLFHITF